MPTYLDLLPDELYRIVSSYLYADVMASLMDDFAGFKTDGIWPPTDFVTLQSIIRNGNDPIRCAYLHARYRRVYFPPHSPDVDWWKLQMDLERPCVQQMWYRTGIVKRYRCYDITTSDCLWWWSAKGTGNMTLAGWLRLLGTKGYKLSHV